MDSIMKWQVRFRAYISELNLPRDDYRGIMEYIEEVPAIEPRGRWITMSDIDGDYYCCSQCGGELPRYSLNTPTWDDPYTYLRSIDKTNFCPNCGADMREEEQND